MATDRRALTLRQAEVLEFIRGHIVAQGQPPSTRMIGAHFGFTATCAMFYIDALVGRKYLVMAPGKHAARFVSLPDDSASPPGGTGVV